MCRGAVTPECLEEVDINCDLAACGSLGGSIALGRLPPKPPRPPAPPPPGSRSERGWIIFGFY